MKEKKRLKYHHQAHCTPWLFALLFSHRPTYTEFSLLSLEAAEARQIREREREREDLDGFLSSTHHNAVTSSHCHLTLSASLLI